MMTTAILLAVSMGPVKPDFGLKVGNVWTYEQTYQDTKTEIKETATRFVEVKPQTYVLEIKAQYTPNSVGYRYLGQNEDGLLSYYNSEMNGPGVSAELKPTVLARMPFNKGLTWKWKEPWRGQTAGEVDERELRKMDEDVSAVVVGENEPIEVPAGKYNAIHVRVTAESQANGRRFEDHWYVFGVGLVKSTYKSPQGEYQRLLTKFEQAK